MNQSGVVSYTSTINELLFGEENSSILPIKKKKLFISKKMQEQLID